VDSIPGPPVPCRISFPATRVDWALLAPFVSSVGLSPDLLSAREVCLWLRPAFLPPPSGQGRLGMQPRCSEWKLDTQLVESVNSSIAINVRCAPAIRLPLLSSRVTTRRFFAAQRRAGIDVRTTLSELQAAHPHAVSWAQAGGASRRFDTPSPPFSSPLSNQEGRAAGLGGPAEAFGPKAAEAAAILAAWLSMCPESRSPTVDVVIGFGTPLGQSAGPDESVGGGEGVEQVTWRSLWFPVLRYYSQIWVVRVLATGKVSQPLEHRKLLAVLEMELGYGVAQASISPD
jgi:hypothetical protein